MISGRFFRISLMGGLSIGIGSALFFFITFQNEFVNPVARFFDVWIALVVVVFFLILIRSGRLPTEPFHFWEGFICGMIMCWTAGLISGLLIWQVSLYYPLPFQHFVDSGILSLQQGQKIAAENLRLSTTLSETEKQTGRILLLKNLDLDLKTMKKMVPAQLFWDEVKVKIMYSFLLVPLISMFMRRK